MPAADVPFDVTIVSQLYTKNAIWGRTAQRLLRRKAAGLFHSGAAHRLYRPNSTGALILKRLVGQPILAAAGFQPARSGRGLPSNSGAGNPPYFLPKIGDARRIFDSFETNSRLASLPQ